MILIADSGSTKTDWVLIDGDQQRDFKTIGYNPYFVNSENIYHSLSEQLVPHLTPNSIKHVHFYGAGCSTSANQEIVKKALVRCFINSEVNVGHDMLAAARALLGRKKGFAAIIGTGANTCFYDGNDVTQNIDSLGYLLGDEGSGCYIGRKVVVDFMRGYLPADLRKEFVNTYHITNDDIYDCIYNKPLPNRYLASFCMFADNHRKHPHIEKIVMDAFNDFFAHLVSHYPKYQDYTFNCVGSVAFTFREMLLKVADKYKMKPGKIINSPIRDLVDFHIQEAV